MGERKIAIVAGKNKVDTQNKATPIKSQTAQPEFAIDMGQMGGMYSGYIHMVGTEKVWAFAIKVGTYKRIKP
nr:hypothetical protein [Proteus mirabilis]